MSQKPDKHSERPFRWGRITYYDPSLYECQIAAQVKEFDGASLWRQGCARLDRCSQYALFAARQAIADANLTITDDNRGRIRSSLAPASVGWAPCLNSSRFSSAGLPG
jgi:3-oxoacyl-(acyl-carrier-protein) synthase